MVAASLYLFAGCSDDSASDPGGDELIDAGVSQDGRVTFGEWGTLVSGDWSLAAGTEGYVCVRVTVDEDIYITDFRALSPLGTHHSVLTVGPFSQPDGTFPCNAATNHGAMIYGAGIGTNEITMPEGSPCLCGPVSNSCSTCTCTTSQTTH